MTVNDNRSLKKLIIILIFHKQVFEIIIMKRCHKSKKSRNWPPLSQIIFGTPHISTIHLFEKKNKFV